MSFYKDFATIYNKIFLFNKTKFNFLNNHLPQGLVLDIACATGQYTNALSSRTRHVIGIDASREMIEQTIPSTYVRYMVKDMTTLQDTSHYNGIFSVGNSLVHITSKKAIYNHLKSLFTALKVNGVLILQIINYDRIFKNNITNLPTIKQNHTSLTRKYSINNKQVLFQTTLQVDDTVYENTTSLYPLRSDELITMLHKVGFKSIKSYGSFEETTYNKQMSYHFIVKATKPMN